MKAIKWELSRKVIVGSPFGKLFLFSMFMPHFFPKKKKSSIKLFIFSLFIIVQIKIITAKQNYYFSFLFLLAAYVFEGDWLQFD